jgi:hypothetical protein
MVCLRPCQRKTIAFISLTAIGAAICHPTLSAEHSASKRGIFTKSAISNCDIWNNAPQDDGIIEWYGSCKDGKATGVGAIRSFQEGELVSYGFLQMLDGKRNGFGSLSFTDGDYYVGNFKDDQRDGWGIQKHASGSRYVGEWKNDKFHGRGTYIFSSGSRYVGEWKNGKYDGAGEHASADGHHYVGQFKLGKRNGRGTATFPDGATYVGEFADGLPNGLGTYTFSDGRKLIGVWVNGKFIEPSNQPYSEYDHYG